MEFWEFLLQKEGDRTWLPLEAAKVEILEGRYRVMAHSSHTNTPVEIRVCQMLLEDTPPKRRILKRASQTNQDGLMVVMPFTRLQPGAWELQCISQAGANIGWRYSVQLQVLSQEDETSGEWNPSWEETETREDAAANTSSVLKGSLKGSDDTSEQQSGQRSQLDPPADMFGNLPKTAEVGANSTAKTANTDPLQNASEDWEKTPPLEDVTEAIKLADQLSRQIVDSVFKEIEQALTDSTSTLPQEFASTTPAEEFTSATIPACEIDLSQSAFMAQPDCSLAISGQIVSGQPSTTANVRLPASELRIYLRDPHNAEVLFEQTYPLQSTELPANFTLDLALPSPLPTRLMLGEIRLHLLSPQTTSAAWASQSFTITAPIHELLEAIANKVEGQNAPNTVSFSLEIEEAPEETPDEKPEEEFHTDEAAPSILNDFALAASQAPPKVLQPLSQKPLPPQLFQPDLGPTVARTPDLPTFSIPSPALQPDSPTSVDQSCSTDHQLSTQVLIEPSTERLEIIEESVSEESVVKHDLQPDPDDFAASQPECADFDPVDPELAAATIQSMGEEAVNRVAKAKHSSVDTAFRALNLQERFWLRLSALTTEGYRKAAEFRAAVEAAGVRMSSAAVSAAAEPPAEGAWIDQATAVAAALKSDQQCAEEIVVYEEPIEAEPIQSSADHAAAESIKAESRAGGDEIEDDIETVTPTPVLKIPAVELTAGEVIAIDVSLPTVESQTYVKLWVSDRQTRTLLDKPRWLMDLQSQENGELFTSLRWKAPLGCTEIRFTAIAVNLVTQQESYKAVVDRTVFPPDLPPLILDEFEV